MRRAALALAALATACAACTGIGIREFTRESYLAPESSPAPSRVFDASPERVWSAWVAELAARQGVFEVRVDALRRGVARLPWRSPAEAADSLTLGSVHRVVTETTRRYRSWSPLDFDCNACVVRNGEIVDQQTRVLEEDELRLDPAAYRLELRVAAAVETVSSGSRLRLELDVEIEPREPPGLQAASTGRLEARLLDAVEARLR